MWVMKEPVTSYKMVSGNNWAWGGFVYSDFERTECQ